MKKIKLAALVFFLSFQTEAQQFKSESSSITFFSKASIEDISAANAKGISLFNTETGAVAFSVPIIGFKFKKKLMEEHFNEKYLDTEKFPLSTFEGKITGYQPTASGVQQVQAQGKLSIHGISKEVTVPGTLEISGDKITMKSKFKAKLVDYEIPRPQLLWQNIAEEIEITVEFNYKPHEK